MSFYGLFKFLIDVPQMGLIPPIDPAVPFPDRKVLIALLLAAPFPPRLPRLQPALRLLERGDMRGEMKREDRREGSWTPTICTYLPGLAALPLWKEDGGERREERMGERTREDGLETLSVRSIVFRLR